MSLSRHRRYLLNPHFGDAFCAVDDSFGIDNNHACYTYETWRDAAESYREGGHEETERNEFNTCRDYWWVLFILFISFNPFSNLSFLSAAESQ